MTGSAPPYHNLPHPLRSFGASVKELLLVDCEARERTMDGTITPEHLERLDAQLGRVEEELAPLLYTVESKIPTAVIILAEARATRDALLVYFLMRNGTKAKQKKTAKSESTGPVCTESDKHRVIEDIQPLSRTRRNELKAKLQAELLSAADSVVSSREDSDGRCFVHEWSKVLCTGIDENGIPVFEISDTTPSQPPGAGVLPADVHSQSPSGAVKIMKDGKGVIVNGERLKDPLTDAQYDVVCALVEAGANGLTKDQLDRKSNHGDSRKVLGRLANKKDPDWGTVIRLAGRPGGHYRIL